MPVALCANIRPPSLKHSLLGLLVDCEQSRCKLELEVKRWISKNMRFGLDGGAQASCALCQRRSLKRNKPDRHPRLAELLQQLARLPKLFRDSVELVCACLEMGRFFGCSFELV